MLLDGQRLLVVFCLLQVQQNGVSDGRYLPKVSQSFSEGARGERTSNHDCDAEPCQFGETCVNRAFNKLKCLMNTKVRERGART